MKANRLPRPLLAAAMLCVAPAPALAVSSTEIPVTEQTWEEACAVDGSSYALRIDERVLPTCEAVFGSPVLRAMNEGTRSARLLRVVHSDARVDVLYQDPTLRGPEVHGFEGVELLAVVQAEVEELSCDVGEEPLADDRLAETSSTEEPEEPHPPQSEGVEPAREYVALVRLEAPFTALCKGEVYALRVDDALGEEGQVVSIGPSGMLVLYRGGLAWVRGGESAWQPKFRMIWRSDFVLLVDGGSAKKAPKKRVQRRRRRGRR